MSDLEIPSEDEGENEERASSSRFVPWLIIVALALLFLPLYFGSITIQDSTGPLSTQLAGIAATLTAPPQVPDAEQTLSVQALMMRAQLNSVVQIPPTLIAGHIDWPGIMSALLDYNPNQIRLTGFVNDALNLTLTGQAVEESSVLSYVSTLQQTGFFAQVRVQTINVSPMPSPTPNLNPTPSGDAQPLAQIYMPFDFNLSIDLAGAAVDLDNIRTLLVKWLPAFIIMMILLGIALFAVKALVPNVQKYQALSDQVVSQGDLAGTQVAEQNDPTNQVILKHQIDKLQQNLNSAAVDFLTHTEAEEVLNRLYNYAYSRGVRVASLQAQTSAATSPDGAYDALVYQVQVGGGVSNLIDFIAHFKEASLPAVNILGLSALSTSDQATLTMTLEFYTSPFASGQALYNFPSPQPIPPSPTPTFTPMPTSTPTETLIIPTNVAPTATYTPSPIPPTPTATNTLTPTIIATPVMSPTPRSALIATDETVVCAGAPPTLFKTGDVAVVHFVGLGALRVLSDPNAPVTSTRTQAYDNQRLEIIAGPVCASQTYYWYIRNTSQNSDLGWVAEGQGAERWLCPDTDPECTNVHHP